MNRALQIAQAFNCEGVEYELFGGVAATIHGLPRNTENADFLVDPSPGNVARIKRALRSLWNDPTIDEIHDDDMVSSYPAFEYKPPDEDYGVLVVSRLAEASICATLESQLIEIDDVNIQVVTPETLAAIGSDQCR